MKKFKLGDRVRITGNTNGSCNKIGDTGIIIEAHGGGSFRVNCGRYHKKAENWTKPDEMVIEINPKTKVI